MTCITCGMLIIWFCSRNDGVFLIILLHASIYPHFLSRTPLESMLWICLLTLLPQFNTLHAVAYLLCTVWLGHPSVAQDDLNNKRVQSRWLGLTNILLHAIQRLLPWYTDYSGDCMFVSHIYLFIRRLFKEIAQSASGSGDSTDYMGGINIKLSVSETSIWDYPPHGGSKVNINFLSKISLKVGINLEQNIIEVIKRKRGPY